MNVSVWVLCCPTQEVSNSVKAQIQEELASSIKPSFFASLLAKDSNASGCNDTSATYLKSKETQCKSFS